MKFAIIIPVLIVVFGALCQCGVSGDPVGNDEITPLPPTVDSTGPPSPITITNTGNDFFEANLPDPGTLEFQVNFYDLHISDNFGENDVDEGEDEDCDSEEPDDADVANIIGLAELYNIPEDMKAKLRLGESASKDSQESPLDFPQVNGQPMESTRDSIIGVEKDPTKFTVSDLEEIAEMYTDMALCTRIIKYTAMLDAYSLPYPTLQGTSSLSVNTLHYFAELYKCMTENKAYKPLQASSIVPSPTTAAQKLSTDEPQKQIQAPSTTTNIPAVFTAANIGIHTATEHGPTEKSHKSQSISFPSQQWKYPAPVDSPPVEKDVVKKDDPNEGNEDEPVEESVDFVDDDIDSGDEDVFGVVLGSVIIIFFLFAFVAGMCYDNILWRSILDSTAEPRMHKQKPIWLVLKDNHFSEVPEAYKKGGDNMLVQLV